MNTDDMETVGIEPTRKSRHRADRVERLRIVSDGTPRSTRVTREGSDEVLMVTGFVLSQPDPGSPLTGSVDVLVPSVDVVADCKVRETSMERERVYAELDRLYLLLALFDRRDGTYIADLVRSAREGFERSAPDMAEDDAWGEFDRLWARRDSAAAVVPVTPTTENPYPRGAGHGFNAQAWDEGFAAGRAAGYEQGREDAIEGLDVPGLIADAKAAGRAAGFAAADSWWRSRLVSDETVEAVARVIAGPAKCCCDDDWRQPRSRVCPAHGEGSWPYQHHYAKARAALAALLPVAEKPPEPRAFEPGFAQVVRDAADAAVAEKPETDT